MIKLTRLNKTSLAVNADLIKFVENAPDTVISLTTGEKVVVRESTDQIIDLVMAYRRALLSGGSGCTHCMSASDKQIKTRENVKEEGPVG